MSIFSPKEHKSRYICTKDIEIETVSRHKKKVSFKKGDTGSILKFFTNDKVTVKPDGKDETYDIEYSALLFFTKAIN